MNRKALFLILALVAIVVGIGSKGSTGPQPSIQSELTEAQHRLDELLTLLEAELDRQRESGESHHDNLRKLAQHARGDELPKTDREILRTRRYLVPGR